MADFQALIFSFISAVRIWMRVSKNSFSSALVSDKTEPRDLSWFTVGPPNSQSCPHGYAHQRSDQDNVDRIFARDLVGPQARAVIPVAGKRPQFRSFLSGSSAQIFSARDGCLPPLLC